MSRGIFCGMISVGGIELESSDMAAEEGDMRDCRDGYINIEPASRL